ncbi:MAG: stress response translation initiation inhibitor YciH [Candidatus Hydrothermarchaeota archaeon]|jgi:translation initiation factor 1|nr:stress response translation initiation inhibitor YciH [Candidatus Hydrothermarchaeota archaeon]
MAVCEVCGLPKELCVCEDIAREIQKIKVYTTKRKFGKLMTVVEGIDGKSIDLKELVKTLKTKCACGGTLKDKRIELQGDQKKRVRDMLLRIGFSQELIELQ